MAQTEHYNFWYLDPDEEISDFPNTWDFNIDKIDTAIHDASTADKVAATRITGTLAAARIPSTIARTSATDTLEDRIKRIEDNSRESGRRSIGGLMENGSGNIYVQRRGDCVELNLYGVEPDGEPSNALIHLFGTSGFPNGFRPTASWSGPCGYLGESTITGIPRLFMTRAGRLDVNNPGAMLYAQYFYFTNDPWPPSLVGEPA